MKAVNLIPGDERRGAGGAAGRSGGGAYLLLGGLALVVVMLVAYAVTTKSVNDKKSELAKVQSAAVATEGEAAKLAPYKTFAALKTARLQTVTSIAASRFDWAHVMHELSRTLPRNITLSGIKGTVAPDVQVTDGPSVPLRAALSVPALELEGCAPSQAAIPAMLTSLRQIDGTRRVTLQQSVYQQQAQSNTAVSDTQVPKAPGAKAQSGVTLCQRKFQAVIFFDPKPAPTAPAAAPAATTVPASTGGAK